MLSSGQLELKDIGSARSPHVEERNGSLDPDLSDDVKAGFTVNDQRDMQRMGKKQELRVCISGVYGFPTVLTQHLEELPHGQHYRFHDLRHGDMGDLIDVYYPSYTFDLVRRLTEARSNTPGLTAGGRPALFWSLVWAYCGQFFIVLSMAEMSSM